MARLMEAGRRGSPRAGVSGGYLLVDALAILVAVAVGFFSLFQGAAVALSSSHRAHVRVMVTIEEENALAAPHPE